MRGAEGGFAVPSNMSCSLTLKTEPLFHASFPFLGSEFFDANGIGILCWGMGALVLVLIALVVMIEVRVCGFSLFNSISFVPGLLEVYCLFVPFFNGSWYSIH